MSFIISNTLQHLQHAEMLNRLNNYWLKNVSEIQGSPRFNSARFLIVRIYLKQGEGPSWDGTFCNIVKLREGSLTALLKWLMTWGGLDVAAPPGEAVQGQGEAGGGGGRGEARLGAEGEAAARALLALHAVPAVIGLLRCNVLAKYNLHIQLLYCKVISSQYSVCVIKTVLPFHKFLLL